MSQFISITSSNFAHRNVDRAQDENLVKGPKEAFVESSQINLSLICKQVKDENLINEEVQVGKRSKNAVQIVYIKDLVNNELVNVVKQRIGNIDADTVPNLEQLEQ